LAVLDSPFGRLGQRWRGHEFHYATVLNEGGAVTLSKGGVEPLLKITDAAGNVIGFQGLRRGTTMGSFVHLIAEAERA
jgi:cobyrinic acid a,c-diamide synthase